MLCQLSYTHHHLKTLTAEQSAFRPSRRKLGYIRVYMGFGARQKGFEPLTRGLEGRCSFP